MKQEIREKAKEFSQKKHWDFCEIVIEGPNVRQQMEFNEPEDLDFDLISYYFHGRLERILKHAKIVAKAYKSGLRAYEEFKPYIEHYVGWNAFVSKEKNPMLRTSKAYDLVIDRLLEVCMQGEKEARRRKKIDD